MSSDKIINLVIQCPHCLEYIFIDQLNCCIFRHGIFISNGQQIPPHSSKQDCDYFVKNKMVYGCANPFKIIDDKAYKCEYI